MSTLGVTSPSALLLMENENTIVVGDSKGLHTVNIIDSKSPEKSQQLGKVNMLTKLYAKDAHKLAVYGACFDDGSVKLYRE